MKKQLSTHILQAAFKAGAEPYCRIPPGESVPDAEPGQDRCAPARERLRELRDESAARAMTSMQRFRRAQRMLSDVYGVPEGEPSTVAAVRRAKKLHATGLTASSALRIASEVERVALGDVVEAVLRMKGAVP